MNKINFGIIGSGFGTRVMLPCINFVNGLNVSHIANTTGILNSEQINNHKDIRICKVESLIKDPEVDIICIETPPFTHYELIKLAINNKKSVICEKPFVLKEKEGVYLINKIKNIDIFTCINHQLRFHPNIVKIKKLIDNDELGSIRHVEINHHSSQKFSINDFASWWFDEKKGGGQLNALGSHFIDLISYLFGDIASIFANLESFYKKKFKACENYCSILMKLTNGISCNVTTSSATNTDTGLNLIISGSKKKIVLTNFNRLLIFEINNKNNSIVKDISKKDKILGEKVVGLNPWRTSLVYHLDHIQKTLSNKTKYKGCSFKDAIKTLKVINAAKKSNLLGKEININY